MQKILLLLVFLNSLLCAVVNLRLTLCPLPSLLSCICIFCCIDRRRMEESGVELQQLLDEERLSHVPLMVMANKQDLLNALSQDEITLELGLNELRDRTWQILPCSAKTGEGLQEAMEWIVEQINSGKEEAKA